MLSNCLMLESLQPWFLQLQCSSPYAPLINIRFFNESLQSIRSDLMWTSWVALGFIRLTSFIITPGTIILRADRGKMQVCHWSAGYIRWTKIVCKSCIMATIWHFYGDTTNLFMVWVTLEQLVVLYIRGLCALKKWTTKRFLLRSDPFLEDILYFPVCLGNTDWCCQCSEWWHSNS